MKYIGITGHRGSGKTAVAYLLGNVLERIRRNDTKEEINALFNKLCETLRQDNNAIYSCPLYYVYFDEFGDAPKSLISQIIGVDMQVLDSDDSKDSLYINLKDFSIHTDKAGVAITADEYMSRVPAEPKKITKDVYMTLREFIEFFSVDLMQRYLGSNVWVKMLNLSKEKFGDVEEGWRIFADVKFDFESQYIKDNNGFMISTKRLSKKKRTTKVSNKIEVSMDYTINTEGDLELLFEPIYTIAKDIYDKSK